MPLGVTAGLTTAREPLEVRLLLIEYSLLLLCEVDGRDSFSEPLRLKLPSTEPLTEDEPPFDFDLAARRVVMCSGSDGSNLPGLPAFLLPLPPDMLLSVGDI